MNEITERLRADYPPGPARHILLRAADTIDKQAATIVALRAE